MSNSTLTVCALYDLAVVSVSGSDATSFLQAQLTQDVEALGADHAALAGFCTARGRLLASMIVIPQGESAADGWLLLAKADAVAALTRRLRMFVLRADVKIEENTSTPIGVRHTTTIADASENGTGTLPGHPMDPAALPIPQSAPPYTVVRHDEQVWISVPGHENTRGNRWWLLNSDVTADSDEAVAQAWQADDIAAGLPWIQAATQEAFIPQTVNMDLIGGVSFTKGCYPGQEVVARSHYRGTIKRRMAYARAEAISLDAARQLAGSDTFDGNRPGRPCGRVVNAAVSDNTLHVLMEVQLADLDQADYRLGADDGPAATVTPLPYSITPEASETPGQ